MDTESNYKINAMIAEFQELRQESRVKLQTQITMISLFVTAMGIVLVQCIGIMTNDGYGVRYYGILSYVFNLIAPAISIFIGVLWLDQACRHIKYGAYISILERKVNALAHAKNTLEDSAMFFEQWWYSKTHEEKSALKTSHYYYYFCCALFYLVPVGCVLFGLALTEWDLRYSYISLPAGAVLYAAYIYFSLRYIIVTFRYNRITENQVFIKKRAKA